MTPEPREEKLKAFLRQPWVIALALAVCFAPWLTTRVEMLYTYQTPPAQTIHPNYFTFHEMSQSWNEGNKLGVIDISRMYINSHRSAVSNYVIDKSPKDQSCMYLSLDPGLAIIVSAARAMFPGLPDSYLRLVALQVILDGVMMFALFLTFLRMGLIPATVMCLAYATNNVFAYNAIFPFQYFWEGWLVGVAILSLIWARRGILAQRKIVPLLLIMLAAATVAFTLWVRSSALVVVIAMIIAFLSVPSLRRYYGAFFLVFALCMAPQIVRASSAAGHFALSTRMSWHTAYQALGRYPNRYGLEDNDLYVFSKSQNEDGVKYNYCDYHEHDVAIEKHYMDVWHKDPGFIVRSVVSRIVGNVLYNSDFDARDSAAVGVVLLAFLMLMLAVRWGGEELFIAGLMGLIYVGYCLAVGLVYSMSSPYAYVAQLALLYFVPIFVAAEIRIISNPSVLAAPMGNRQRLRKFAFWVLCVAFLGGAAILQIPSVKTYLLPQMAYQDGWILFGAPNHPDNSRLTEAWQSLPKDKQQAFLKLVHGMIPPSAEPKNDVSRYFANAYTVIGYTNRDGGDALQTLFTIKSYGVDAEAALMSSFGSIQGLNASEISIIKLDDPSTWDGRKIHIKFVPMPERAGIDYQTLLTQKFNRYNYDVLWQGPNELTAHHRGFGCDALRSILAVFYGGNCPYDPRTGANPFAEGDDTKTKLKNPTTPVKSEP